jgi:thioester reductase-like protein
MPERRPILLTGATGLLGRYLLPSLLLKGNPVAVLARPAGGKQAAERIAEIMAFWKDRLRTNLKSPLVLAGELGPHGLGLTLANRQWLTRHRPAVIHAAANLSFRQTPESEPWRTNLEGTRSLLQLCREAGVTEWHQVSTAFVCGRRTGFIPEEELDPRPSFHNPYEESKFRAEELVRRTPGMVATIYRPAVIVGDSRTGYTSSFAGLYRFLELAVRLGRVKSSAGATFLPLRLPLSGEEPWNLVPVDWVARAIAALVGQAKWHGRTFHLVAQTPVSTRFIRDIGAWELKLRGVEFAGPGGVTEPSRLEKLFLNGIQEYWPYLGGNPQFDFANTAAALPHLPPPAVDRRLLKRLIRFAVQYRWGRGPSLVTDKLPPAGASHCADYIERIFPRQAKRSRLAREVGLDLTIGVVLRGPGGGQWSCKWVKGELIYARPGLDAEATVTYRTDTATFEAVLNGRQTPQEAFFAQRIDIKGHLETALKLAVLFEKFLAENLVESHRTEVMDSTSFPH